MNTESKSLEITATSDTIARRLKKLRTEYKYAGADGKQHHLSHEVLSQRLEEFGVSVSVSTLKNYEASSTHNTKALSNTGMSIKTLCALAALYNVSADYILGLSDVPSISVSKQQASKTTGLSEKAIVRVSALMRPKDEISKTFDTMLGRGELTALLREVVECRQQVREIDKTYLKLAKTMDNETAWRDCRHRLWHTKRDFSDAIERTFAVITGTSVAEKKIGDALEAIAKEQALMEDMEYRELYMEQETNDGETE